MDAERELLQRAGLTEYQARAYLALLSLGPTTAAQAAAEADIPRTRIYSVLTSLEHTWVTVREGRPRTFAARDPETCLDAARREFEDMHQAALPALLGRFHAREQRFAGPLWVLEGQESVIERSLTMIRRARASVLIALPPTPEPGAPLVAALVAAQQRGIHVRVAGDTRHRAAFDRARLPFRSAAVPFQILVVDGRQGLLGVLLPREGGTAVMKAIWNPNPELASLLAQALPPALGWSQPP